MWCFRDAKSSAFKLKYGIISILRRAVKANRVSVQIQWYCFAMRELEGNIILQGWHTVGTQLIFIG